jgi:hypothetical protein
LPPRPSPAAPMPPCAAKVGGQHSTQARSPRIAPAPAG